MHVKYLGRSVTARGNIFAIVRKSDGADDTEEPNNVSFAGRSSEEIKQPLRTLYVGTCVEAQHLIAASNRHLRK